MLDFNIYLHLELFLLFSEYIDDDSPILKPDIKDEDHHDRLRFFGLSLCNLTNSLIAIRTLLEGGLDLQAKQVFRSYIEYSDISIASLESASFYLNYIRMAEGEKEANEVWWKYTRPAAIEKILKKIFLNFGNDGLFWEMIQSIRKPSYELYSDYTHGHFLANTLSAFSRSNESDLFRPTITGSITYGMTDTLDRSIAYSHLFVKHAMIILVKDHHLPFEKFGENGKNFVVFYKMMEVIWPIMIEKLNMFGENDSPNN